MQSYLPEHLPDFSHASLLIIGDVMLDKYWFGKASRISPEAPVPIVSIDGQDNRPGGAGNVALNITALGAKAMLIGITGQDEAATILEEQLSAARVRHDLLKQPNKKTITKLRVISRQQQLIRLDFEEKLADIDINQEDLITRFKQHLTQANLVILSDYNKGTLSNPQIFIQLAREANVPILIDPKSKDFSIYRGATMITPNFKEFEEIVGSCASEQDILTKGCELLERHQIEMLLVTRGENGMTFIRRNEAAIHLPAYAREVCDVTGAGDTVIAVLGAALAAGASPSHAVALANIAASLTVAKLGAASVCMPELEIALTGKKAHDITGIVNEEQLYLAVQAIQQQGKKVVFTNGCYDLLHPGHLGHLQQAKQLGDYLIVAVNADESVRRLKGPGRPINNQDHRMTVLAGLGVVDWVICFDDDTPERLLKRIKPDILAKGIDYTLDKVVGADIVYAYGGEVRLVGPGLPINTTSIIASIKQSQEEQTT